MPIRGRIKLNIERQRCFQKMTHITRHKIGHFSVNKTFARNFVEEIKSQASEDRTGQM